MSQNEAPLDRTSAEIAPKESELRDALGSMGAALVAFSGGVDSAYLAAMARQTLGDRVRAVIGVSPSLQRENLERAREIASSLGLELIELSTGEMENPDYVANGPDRCFHCKSTLYEILARVAGEASSAETVLDGTNADDLRDVRPGRRAAGLHGVRSPLAELGFTKNDIRQGSRAMNLPTWSLPASPCLSSRIRHGIPVTVTGLRRIEESERAVRALGFRIVRVRDEGRGSARVEVGVDELNRLPSLEQRIKRELKGLGFVTVTVDPSGYRVGGANSPLEPQDQPSDLPPGSKEERLG